MQSADVAAHTATVAATRLPGGPSRRRPAHPARPDGSPVGGGSRPGVATRSTVTPTAFAADHGGCCEGDPDRPRRRPSARGGLRVRRGRGAAAARGRRGRPTSSTTWSRAGSRARRWRRCSGWAEFCGLRIAVDPGVFVPRHADGVPRRAGRRAGPTRRGGRRPLLRHRRGGRRRGRGRARRRGARRRHRPRRRAPAHAATCRASTRATSTPPFPIGLRGRVDLLVVNAPYVPTDAIATMPPEARDHEPRVALDGGADGLDVQRRVAADAPPGCGPVARS